MRTMEDAFRRGGCMSSPLPLINTHPIVEPFLPMGDTPGLSLSLVPKHQEKRSPIFTARVCAMCQPRGLARVRRCEARDTENKPPPLCALRTCTHKLSTYTHIYTPIL